MVVRAEGQAVVGFVIAADAEGNDVGSLHQGQVVADFHADAAGGAAVIVDLQNGMAEGAVSTWRLVAQDTRQKE
jgi:hypothetical protein